MHAAGAPAIPAFAVATVALGGLAWVVSLATEELGRHTSPGITGLLQSTLGNLPELFVVLFALNAGQRIVAQTSILGSIFSNALLVLGLVIVVGAPRSDDMRMRFHPRLPRDTSTLLLVTAFVIVLVAISVATDDAASSHVKEISIIAAIAILILYLLWAVAYIRADRAHAASHPENVPAQPPRVGLEMTLALLVVGGIGSAFVSDWFVDALAPAIKLLHLSPAFAGLVIVAIAGNAVEHAAGIVLAARGEAELAIAVVVNSVAQVAAFLFPVLVLGSLFFGTHLTFAIPPVYVGALLLTGLAVWEVTATGEAPAFQGFALVALYVILAALTLFE
jgi:Ca2+:H+ antiporter